MSCWSAAAPREERGRLLDTREDKPAFGSLAASGLSVGATLFESRQQILVSCCGQPLATSVFNSRNVIYPSILPFTLVF